MKILTLLKDVQDLDTVNKGTLLATQNCASIGLPLEFTFKTITNNFTSVKTSKDTFNQVDGYAVNSAEVFQVAKSFGIDFNLALLIFDWTKITPQPTNPSDGGLAISIPTEWFTTFPEVLSEFILHEICHALFSASGQSDTTHAYPPAFGQKSRSDYYLYLILSLKSYWNALVTPQNAPTATLTRNNDNGVETLGTLATSDLKFQCRTLELSYKNNQQNISSIPVGTYLCKWQFMLRELSYHYCLQNVKGRSGIFIHSGNYFFDSKGCIIVGSTPTLANGQMMLLNSKTILSYFEMLLGKKDFNLTIK